MPVYDTSRFQPPAPTAEVILRNLDDSCNVDGVPMLLDFGSDITLIPEESVAELGVTPLPNQECELMGFDGAKRSVPVYELQMIFVGKKFKGHYLVVAKDYGIIGRNILNHLAILLDGPRLEWNEWKDAFK